LGISYRSAVLIVEDIEASRHFYEGLLGQNVEMDHGECVEYVGGFAIWQKELAHRILNIKEESPVRASHELYFESNELDEVYLALQKGKIDLVHDLIEHPWGQRAFRVYDPDGHVIELGEPMDTVVIRYLKQGLSAEETSKRTSMPLEIVNQIDQAFQVSGSTRKSAMKQESKS
jgi:catechol 2,3-dioxygenase-like lactoylglutathione lyase family enzyme